MIKIVIISPSLITHTYDFHDTCRLYWFDIFWVEKQKLAENISHTKYFSNFVYANYSVFVCNYLFFETLMPQRVSLIIKFVRSYKSLNSR